MSSVLDASAMLALVNHEPGAQRVLDALGDAAISTINLSEVVAKLTERGVTEEEVHQALDDLDVTVVDFDLNLAYAAGLLRLTTRAAGLSFGDRACVALAGQLGATVLTADRAWGRLQVGVTVEMIR